MEQDFRKHPKIVKTDQEYKNACTNLIEDLMRKVRAIWAELQGNWLKGGFLANRFACCNLNVNNLYDLSVLEQERTKMHR